MRADAGVEAHTIDYSLRVETLHLGICIELVEVAHAQCEVGVGKELHRLSLLDTHLEHGHILL